MRLDKGVKITSFLSRAAALYRRAIRGNRRDRGAAGGRFITRTYRNHAGSRRYKTYIPAVYDGQALPLVVMLHGCKQTPDDFAAGTRMNALAEERGFLVVYPAQSAMANVSRCWNWFKAAHQQRDEGEPSVIAGITRKVIARYNVDARRVHVIGLSAGGAMASIMARMYPELYVSAGIHSGLPYASASDAYTALAAMRGRAVSAPVPLVPTIVFHGDRDTTVHPSNGEKVIATAQLQPDAVEKGETGGRAYTRTTHRSETGPAMEHWLVHGAGHAWSGGSTAGSYADPQGPDAAREMLRFFRIA